MASFFICSILIGESLPAYALKGSSHFFGLRSAVVQSRLIRSDADSATGTFSILSNTGIVSELVYGYNLWGAWNTYLEADYTAYTYEGPTSRTFTGLEQSTLQYGWTNELAYRYVRLFVTVQNRPLILLKEESAANYLVDKVDIQLANIGIKLTARAKDFDLHAVGYVSVPATTPLYNDSELTTLQSSLHGDFYIRFGKEFRYGFHFLYQLDNYTVGNATYTVNHLGFGLFTQYGF
ncbi:MAG: hypothetical protein KDD61_08860 [Bdellovibrionales bacterium]|nr:hypothetical protein [Bdellovibrionales bacterium]